MTTVVKTSLKNDNLWPFKLYRVYLNPLISSNPGVEFLRTLPRFKKRGDMYMKYSRMFTSFINQRIRRFQVVVVQWTSNWNLLKKKKVMHVQTCCFAHKTNCFLTLPLSPSWWLLKLSIFVLKDGCFNYQLFALSSDKHTRKISDLYVALEN